mgnify:CR=1 FL=1
MGNLAVTATQVAVVFPEKAEIWPAVAGVAVEAGNVVYQIAASGRMGLADEDDGAETSLVWGVALKRAGPGQGLDVLRRGHVFGFDLSGLDAGAAVSLSATPGALLDTGATTNIVGRVVRLTDAAGTKVLYVDCSLGAVS